MGSDVTASGNTVLSAGGNVNIVSAAQETSNDVSYNRKTHGGITPKPGDASFDVMRATAMTGSVQTQTERGSNVTAGGNLTVAGGKDVNVYASNLTAGSDLALTISIGVVGIEKGEPFDNQLNAADQLLYLAKANGRNRVYSDVMIEETLQKMGRNA